MAPVSRQASPTKASKPPSILQKQVEQTKPSSLAHNEVPQATQFATTPRFSASRPKPLAGTSRPRAPVKPALIDALRSTGRPREDVEEARDDEDEEMLDGEQVAAYPIVEGDDVLPLDASRDLPFSPKRRRLDDDLRRDEYEHATAPSPARPTFKHPLTPASELRNQAHRYSQPPNSTIPSIADNTTTQPRRPFLRPSLAPQEPTEPLPEAFSPHRRGQKFIPGGLASTVQQWVLETGQAAVQSRRGQAYLRGEDFTLKVKLEEVKGEGPYLALARTGDGNVVSVMLTQGDGGAEVKEGSFVGIRAPTWQVEVEGRAWRVAVGWKVL